MKSIAGFLLLFVALVSTFFFKEYSWQIIAYPSLWYLFFFGIGVIGFLLIRSGMRGSMEIWKKHTDEKFAHLKANAEKFQVEFDRCEFKNASCYQEVIDENVNPINLLSPGFKYTPTKTESVSNSTLVYHLSDSEKFIESFPMDSVTLKSYVLSNKIVLYVNRFDRDKYGFEVLDQ